MGHRSGRARTIDVVALRVLVDEEGPLSDADKRALRQRPKTRGDCVDGPRPCPWFGCRHHNGIEVTDSGSIKLTEADEGQPTCSLDVAENGGETLEAVAKTLGVTRERARQIETKGLRVIKRAGIRWIKDWEHS